MPPTKPGTLGTVHRVLLFPGIVALALLAAAGLALYWHQRTTRFQMTPKDTIVLADFVNITGEVVFDDRSARG
jgi:hypothetical protein